MELAIVVLRIARCLENPEDRYAALPRVCRAWRDALAVDALVIESRDALERHVESLRARGSWRAPRALVLRGIEEPKFTSSTNILGAEWLHAVLVAYGDTLERLVLDDVHPFNGDAVDAYLAVTAPPPAVFGKGKTAPEKWVVPPPACPRLRHLSIASCRTVSPRAMHTFLHRLGVATSVPPVTWPGSASTASAPADQVPRVPLESLRLVGSDTVVTVQLLQALLPVVHAVSHDEHSYAAPPAYSALPTHADSVGGGLARLDLSGNPDAVTDALLASAVAPVAAQLTHLALAGCLQVTARGLGAVLSSAARLQSLDVAGCARLATDQAGLARGLKAVGGSLRRLVLAPVPSSATPAPWIHPALLDTLASGLPRLESLTVQHTDDDRLPCVCAGLQLPLSALTRVRVLHLVAVPGSGSHGGVPVGLLHRLLLSGGGIETVVVDAPVAVRADRWVALATASRFTNWNTVSSALYQCAEQQCLAGGGDAMARVVADAEGEAHVNAELEKVAYERGLARVPRVVILSARSMKDED
ncbi:hypothetical protein H9P43_009951 [Blastocladiella emersonii ATCC 22665]|nr:hypothetical protein H9P43_009951 [Blastocladiella emersonii ATCC 22665]